MKKITTLEVGLLLSELQDDLISFLQNYNAAEFSESDVQAFIVDVKDAVEGVLQQMPTAEIVLPVTPYFVQFAPQLVN